MADRPPLDLEQVLGYLLVHVAHVVEHGFTELMAAEGVTPRQFAVLVHAGRDDGLGSAELARRLEVTPQSMGDQVDVLVRRGLLARDPHPGPGRRIGLHITAEGRRVLARANAVASAYEARLTAHLDPDAKARLLAELHEVLLRA